MRSCVFLITLLIFHLPTLATNNVASTRDSTFYSGVEISHITGRPIKNHPFFPEFSHSHILNIRYSIVPNKNWMSEYGYPQTGFNIMLGTLGNHEVLGEFIALYPSWTFTYNLIKPLKRFRTQVKLGSGLAYFNRPFHPLNNNENIVIGSSLMNITHVNVTTSISVFHNISAKFGTGFIHFSSGHVKIPNVGYNMIPFTSSLVYTFTAKNEKIVQKPLNFTADSTIRINTRISVGFHEMAGTTAPNRGPVYPVYSLSLYGSKRMSKIRDLGIGLNSSYYVSFYDFNRSEHYFEGNERLNSFVFETFIHNKFLFGHFAFITEAGYKFFNPLFKEIYVNQSSGVSLPKLKQHLNIRLGFIGYPFHTAFDLRNVGVGAFIKANAGQADFVELFMNVKL